MLKSLIASALLAVSLSVMPITASAQEPITGSAPVNGLQMYYEIHGEGAPILLLHGAYMSIPTNWTEMIPTLVAAGRQAHPREQVAERASQPVLLHPVSPAFRASRQDRCKTRLRWLCSAPALSSARRLRTPGRLHAPGCCGALCPAFVAQDRGKA